MTSLDLLPDNVRAWALEAIRQHAKGRLGWSSERAHRWGHHAGQRAFRRERYDNCRRAKAGPFDEEWTEVCPLDGHKYQLGFCCDY